MTEYVLEIQQLNKNFGALQVTSEVSFSLPRGARHALIGPNGAGKTTLVNLLTGVLKPSSGRILLHGGDVTNLSQAARSRLGLTRTYQINQLFKGLSVLDNVCLAIAERSGIATSIWRPLGKYTAVTDEAMQLLTSFRLQDTALTLIKELPYGQQRLVEMLIALAQQPEVLLLDEPAAGVPSAESQLILDAVERLSDNIAVLIIEHDMDIVFRFATQITVLVSGAILTEGTPEQIAADEQVRAVYLGESVVV